MVTRWWCLVTAPDGSLMVVAVPGGGGDVRLWCLVVEVGMVDP